MDRLVRHSISMMVALTLGAGCHSPDSAPVRERSDAAKKNSAPDVTENRNPSDDKTSPDAERLKDPAVTPDEERAARHPARPVDGWVIFREAFKPKEDATCDAVWLGRNEFSVTTRNIKRITIDLTQLPDGAPAKGPWILQLDGQGVELTGFNPEPGYTGLKRDLIRSQNGKWTVDKERLYRTGS